MQLLLELLTLGSGLPRVAFSEQPWAEGCDPFGMRFCANCQSSLFTQLPVLVPFWFHQQWLMVLID
jgi:hypothetical protein